MPLPNPARQLLFSRPATEEMDVQYALSSAATICLGVLLAVWRVFSGHHTFAQIFAGAGTGAIWAYVWFNFVRVPLSRVVEELFAYIGTFYTLVLLVCFSALGLLAMGPL